MNPVLFVVARDRPDLYAHFTREFSTNEIVRVITDRRFDQRRRRDAPTASERRRAERRTGKELGADLRHIGWARVVLG